ncbi:MAG: helix-turn-helix transcriptional regulator [Actinobacteria bacterium]|nr:helix-turn-helix transcriptional regulator [Actinomycetota bacterium]
MAEDSKEIFCPVIATMRLLGQKWTLEIIRALIDGKMRFNELSQALNGLNARTLSARLRALEAEGIVERRLISSIPPWVEYELTPKGQALNSVIEGMAAWGRQWMEPPDAKRH